jgi:hypothetical protein
VAQTDVVAVMPVATPVAVAEIRDPPTAILLRKSGKSE